MPSSSVEAANKEVNLLFSSQVKMMQLAQRPRQPGNERDPCVKLSQQAKVSVAKHASAHGVAAALCHDVGHCQLHNNNHMIELIIGCAL